MTTDRLFVIMLVMLIPMTGCFGAVDNADAQDDTVENTSETIVNNYYYNNTTTTMIEETEYLSNGGVIDSLTPYGGITGVSNGFFGFDDYQQNFFPHNFTTNAGEAVKIHYFLGSGYNNMYLDTECSDGTSFIYGDSGVNQNNYIGGSHTDCDHSVTIQMSDNNYDSNSTSTTMSYAGVSYSMIYSIESVTVV